jgi:hypothetical protein
VPRKSPKKSCEDGILSTIFHVSGKSSYRMIIVPILLLLKFIFVVFFSFIPLPWGAEPRFVPELGYAAP